MIQLLYLTALLLLANGAYQLLKYSITISRVPDENDTGVKRDSPKKFARFFIIAPVLHEEKNISKFINDISRQDYPKKLYEVYAVTTEKERLGSIKPDTIDILGQITKLEEHSDLQLHTLHYPKTDGFKTHQSTYAFNKIRERHDASIISDSFFLLLDADSEVEPDTINRFNSVIEDGVDIYQQPLLWFKNLDEIHSPLMRSFAFLQSFFSISYEIPMFTGSFFPWRLKYLVGHGLCLRGSFLNRIKGFPDIIEDVRMGRLSSFMNIKAKLVPGFGIVETAKNLPTYIKQSSTWFFGCGLFMSDYVYSRSLRVGSRFNFREFTMICYGFFKAFRWLNKGLFHLAGLIFAVLYGSPALVALFLVSLFINSVLPVITVAKDFKKIWERKLKPGTGNIVLFQSMLFSPILYILNFVGLYYGLAKLIRFYLWGQITLAKTER